MLEDESLTYCFNVILYGDLDLLSPFHVLAQQTSFLPVGDGKYLVSLVPIPVLPLVTH